jgi:hypothetical protein
MLYGIDFYGEWNYNYYMTYSQYATYGHNKRGGYGNG